MHRGMGFASVAGATLRPRPQHVVVGHSPVAGGAAAAAFACGGWGLSLRYQNFRLSAPAQLSFTKRVELDRLRKSQFRNFLVSILVIARQTLVVTWFSHPAFGNLRPGAESDGAYLRSNCLT
jgi:hypothetical protein